MSTQIRTDEPSGRHIRLPRTRTKVSPPGYIDSQPPSVLVGRPGDPEELAAAVVFLASPAAGYITGTTLVVDGALMPGS
jgi:NAD(P)-dependent dehydrogenase (short-subunit alcohol dehydrogenase family)